MSWGTCYSGSNNIHFNYPPIMADGRNYADWQPGAVVNERIKEQAGITSNAQYRQYLTHNAAQIMQANQLEACNQCGNCGYNTGNPGNPLQPQRNMPYVFTSTLDNSQPFGYENSDLKNYYLSRQQLQARMIAPVITQHDLLTRGFPNAN
jgi:hypothetical protein